VETPVISPITGEPIDNADSLRLGGYGPNSLYQTNKLGLSTFRQWTISNDPSTASLRYEFVSTRGRDIDRGSINDMRALLATGPFTLAPGGSAATTLAIGIAHPSTTSLTANLDSLIRLMASAHKWFASPEIINGDPNNVVIHNFGAASGGNSVSRGLPAMDAALDAYPNPMRGKGMLRVTLPNDETISLELCDEAGRVLQHIQNEKIFSKGEHEIPFIVGDLVNGRYFVRMTSGAQIVAVPIVVER
jgi:hypothetical protein